VVIQRGEGRAFGVGMDIELNYLKSEAERHDALRWHVFLHGVVTPISRTLATLTFAVRSIFAVQRQAIF
jgi:hypothetical protein